MVEVASNRLCDGGCLFIVFSVGVNVYRLAIEVYNYEDRRVGSYRKLRPLFMGLILGEYSIVGFWMVIGIFTGVDYRGALPG